MTNERISARDQYYATLAARNEAIVAFEQAAVHACRRWSTVASRKTAVKGYYTTLVAAGAPIALRMRDAIAAFEQAAAAYLTPAQQITRQRHGPHTIYWSLEAGDSLLQHFDESGKERAKRKRRLVAQDNRRLAARAWEKRW